ncbi:MAG TPA: malonate decarboxylase holo-ACP synthase [Polyangiaceae bacterium]|nr:malonate decarboxylase holo-ACP synthase [Polyangiaceae bacterium]
MIPLPRPRAHDLLRVRGASSLIAHAGVPVWVEEALGQVPWVVVRRANGAGSTLAIGVRGARREQRFGALVPLDEMDACVTPEQLATKGAWCGNARCSEIPALQALDAIAGIMNAAGLRWGPTGSVGFELASGVATATTVSDLDLLVRAPLPLPHLAARALVSELARLPVRTDVQVETPHGAVALTEIARGEDRFLLRTEYGPRLVADPWTVHP